MRNLVVGLILSGLICCSATLVAAQNANVKPNIVFFLADDMGLGDTSAYQDLTGNPDHYQVDTPNLERLAEMGLRFTDVHSGAAVCTPTRLSLLTGTHPFRSPIKQRTSFVNQDNVASMMPGERKTFVRMLKKSGYGTYGVGKWHVGLQADYSTRSILEGPIEAGFDHYTGTPGNFPGDQGILVDNQLLTYDSEFSLVPFGDQGAITWDPDNNVAITRQIQQTNLDAAQGYLAAHVSSNPDAPFLLYYASHSNHTPYIGPATLDGVVVDGHTKEGSYLDVPTTTNDGQIVPTGPNFGEVDLGNHWEPYLEVDTAGDIVQNGPGERLKLVDENDIAIGKLLDYLEATDDPRNPGKKLIDNTLIVFTSDNGSDIKSEPSVGALPQKSNNVITDISGKKSTLEEGGTRVPFIAVWAGRISEDATSDALFGLNDIYATLAEVVGENLDAKEAVDSESALDALTGGATGDFRESSLVYKSRHRLIIRDGDLKLAAIDPDYNGDGSDRFNGNLDFSSLDGFRMFDLETDLSEQNNLINEPAYSVQRDAMLATLQDYVNQGYSRSGAAAVSNGQNFQGDASERGGSILDADNYGYYGDGTEFEPDVLTTTAPSFVFRNGTAPDRVSAASVVQGNGTVVFNGSQAGLADGAKYEIRGGTLEATSSTFQINDSSELLIIGGSVDLSGQNLRLNKGNATIEISDGGIEASRLQFEDLNSSTSGQKVVRFLAGNDGGSMTLTGSNPFKFGTDRDPLNDYIDFTEGASGRLISTADLADFQLLWTSGRLRFDGQTGDSLNSDFEDYFQLLTLDNGFSSLSLVSAPTLGDFDGDGDVDIDDLDRYNGNIGSVATAALEPLDLNNDGAVGADDFALHYGALVETSNGQVGTFAGDIDLDGKVDVLGDAFLLIRNLGTSATSWGQGDLNGNGTVDVLGDAFLLIGNLGNDNSIP